MPVLLPFAVPLLAFLAALVLLGLSQASTSQHGSSNSGTFGDLLSGRFYFHKLSGFASDFARWIVSRFAASQLRMLSRWFLAMGTLTIGWFTGNAQFSEESVAAMERLQAQFKADSKALHRQERRIEAKLHAEVAAAQHKIDAEAKHLDTYIAQTRPRLAHATHAIDVTIPHDLAGLRARNRALEKGLTATGGRVGELEHGAVKTWDWIRTHPLSATTGVFAGAVAIALGRLGLGGLRCRNFTNLLKNYGCGLGTLLGRLLPLAVFLTIAFDFEDFVKASRFVAAGIGDAVGAIEGQFDPHLPPLPPPTIG